MIERVARAIAWADIKDTEASFDLGTQERKYMRDITTKETMWVDPKYIPIARAAIEAMRDPSDDAMSGCDNDVSGAPYCGDWSYLRDQWNVMIDAALK